MRTLILAFVVMFGLSSVAVAGNSIETNRENCAKIRGMASGDKEAIARKMRVSMSSIRFIKGGWLWYPAYGTKMCAVMVDTAKGPTTCIVQSVHQDSYMVFGSVGGFGNAVCS